MSALEELNEKQERGEELTSLEFAVWYCTDRVCAENAAAELATLREWKIEIENACALDFLGVTTPKETIQKLISVNVEQSLDPAISEKPARWVAEISALREEVERLRALLKTLEYIEEYPSEELLCPICRGEKPTHYEDCDLAAALKG